MFITLSNYLDIKLLLEYFLATVKAYIQSLILISLYLTTVIESAKQSASRAQVPKCWSALSARVPKPLSALSAQVPECPNAWVPLSAKVPKCLSVLSVQVHKCLICQIAWVPSECPSAIQVPKCLSALWVLSECPSPWELFRALNVRVASECL